MDPQDGGGVGNDRVRAGALSLARLGWQVVPCYGITRDDERSACSCIKGADCVSPGKHPIGKAWETTASSNVDAVGAWDCWKWEARVNVGVRWGEASGVIDVEFDCDAGRETIDRLGLTDCDTPTFRSSRSVHRVFRWQPGLPDTAVLKVAGLEVRIGNRPCQSIVPPSSHASGVDYEWVDGRTPWEVPVMELPVALESLILAGSIGASTDVARLTPSARAIYGEGSGEGARHDALLRLATRKMFDLRDLEDRAAVDLVLDDLRLVNETRCKPPKPDTDVVNCWRSAYQYAVRTRAAAPVEADEIPKRVQEAAAAAGRWKDRAEEAESEARAAETRAAELAADAEKLADEALKKAAERKVATATRAAAKARERAEKLAGRAEKASGRAEEAAADVVAAADPLEPTPAGFGVVGLEGVGLEFRGGEWFPGAWRMEIVRSDPPIYRVIFPWEGHEVRIELGPDSINKPATVAAAIRAGTGNLLVDEVPGVWPAAWNGTPGKAKKPAKVGVFAKLVRAATWVEPIRGVDNRIGTVAAAFLAELTVGLVPAEFPADDDADDVTDRPHGAKCYARDGGKVRLFFRWPDVWRAATERNKSLTDAESRKLRRLLGESGGELGSKLVRNGPLVSRLAYLDRVGFEELVRLAQE